VIFAAGAFKNGGMASDHSSTPNSCSPPRNFDRSKLVAYTVCACAVLTISYQGKYQNDRTEILAFASVWLIFFYIDIHSISSKF
jgi:hypothetical protein